jgi:hypothetical protein
MMPRFKPSTTAAVSISAPRLVLISITPGFSLATAAASIMCFVLGSSGTCNDMMSARERSGQHSLMTVDDQRTRSREQLIQFDVGHAEILLNLLALDHIVR